MLWLVRVGMAVLAIEGVCVMAAAVSGSGSSGIDSSHSSVSLLGKRQYTTSDTSSWTTEASSLSCDAMASRISFDSASACSLSTSACEKATCNPGATISGTGRVTFTYSPCDNTVTVESDTDEAVLRFGSAIALNASLTSTLAGPTSMPVSGFTQRTAPPTASFGPYNIASVASTSTCTPISIWDYIDITLIAAIAPSIVFGLVVFCVACCLMLRRQRQRAVQRVVPGPDGSNLFMVDGRPMTQQQFIEHQFSLLQKQLQQQQQQSGAVPAGYGQPPSSTTPNMSYGKPAFNGQYQPVSMGMMPMGQYEMFPPSQQQQQQQSQQQQPMYGASSSMYTPYAPMQQPTSSYYAQQGFAAPVPAPPAYDPLLPQLPPTNLPPHFWTSDR
ncbi:hypothetical protein BC831DRAFT_477266, partial [Entophlyctis helioformis]